MDGYGAAVSLPAAPVLKQSTPPRRLRWSVVGNNLLWLLPLIFLSVFFLLPLGRIFFITLQSIPEQAVQPAALWKSIARPLGFTLLQAGLSTLFTLALGLPAAYIFGRYRFPGRRALRLLTTLPFILPTVVVAAGFNALLGPRGWVNLLLMDSLSLDRPPITFLNTLTAILVVHVFYNLSVVLRVVGGAWERLDPRLEQAARSLGASPWQVFTRVTFPLLRSSILAAGVLVFLFCFTSFGVILLLGGPRFSTLETEIYIQAMQMLNLPLAGVLSLVQMLCTLTLTLLSGRLGAESSFTLSPRILGENLRVPRKGAQQVLVGLLVAGFILFSTAPLAALAVRSVTRLEANRGARGETTSGLTLDYYREMFFNRRGSLFYVPPIAAAGNSLLYGLATVAISLGLGFPAAYALNRSGAAGRWLNVLLILPLGASAVTLGLGYVVTFNRPPLDPRSFPLLIPIAHSLVALPFVVRTLQPAIASLPPSLRQAAAVLGASPLVAWWKVELPILSRAALVGAVFAFTISLGEFGATSMLARPETPTLPIAIFRFLAQPGALNYGQGMAASCLLLLFCAGALFIIERTER